MDRTGGEDEKRPNLELRPRRALDSLRRRTNGESGAPCSARDRRAAPQTRKTGFFLLANQNGPSFALHGRQTSRHVLKTDRLRKLAVCSHHKLAELVDVSLTVFLSPPKPITAANAPKHEDNNSTHVAPETGGF
ncbi:hypothetical protein KL944_001185 [Ogataea haglerorum]|nr:hypothetical protein KL944_001185 [Ogataea haglerorum]